MEDTQFGELGSPSELSPADRVVAVMLFCHGQSQPLLDVNMARVLERVYGPRKLADIRYDPYLQELAGKIVRSKYSARLNWAVLDLAATICLLRTPRCGLCPVASLCQHAAGRTTN